MLFAGPIEEIKIFLKSVLEQMKVVSPQSARLSRSQLHWFSLCMSAMIFMGMLCFQRIERSSAGLMTGRAFSWMFCSSKINWEALFEASILRLLKLFGIRGFLVVDDTDRPRAKGTKKLFGVHKQADKKTGGFSTGQNLVVLLFVTKFMTFPVGFKFYRPDPAWVAWKENDKKLRGQGVPGRLRPKKPERNPDFPTKITIACGLIQDFSRICPTAKIDAVNADAAYSCPEFIRTCEAIFPGTQVISQIRGNQLIRAGNKPFQSAQDFFASKTTITTKILIRGKKEQEITYASARVWVKSQQRTLHVIALKYPGETDFRFITANNLTWKALDVVRAYATRWLIEVFFQDWKAYDGWGKSACQRGYEGARRGVILSLLVDHFLLSHSLQLARVKAGIAAFTAGSLQRYLQSRAILDSVTQILGLEDPKAALRELYQSIEKWVDFRPSDKHMTGRELGEFAPSPSLAIKFKHKK
jgi:hypothetical protein